MSFYYCSVPLNVFSQSLYAQVYELHNIYNLHENQEIPGHVFEDEHILLPYPTVPASLERIDLKGIYLIDSGEYIYLYVLRDADPDLILQLFGVETFQEMCTIDALPYLEENDFNVRVNNMVD